MNKKKSHIVLILLVLLTFGNSCEFFKSEANDPVVARVLDAYLYESDLISSIPEGISSADSSAVARAIIDSWIRKQLLLAKAEEALTDEQKDVERKIEEYRSSLLIYSYRQKLLNQKLDTVISIEEIREYYDSNIDNFVLNDEVVKAIFVKVPLSAPNIGNVRTWTRSANDESLDQLEKYCLNYAEKFDVFDHSWVYFTKVLEQVPLDIQQTDRYLRYNQNIETSDSDYHYFVRIIEHKTSGTTTPLELIQEEIKSILLNKRKIEFFKDLELQVYNEAANRNQFEIY